MAHRGRRGGARHGETTTGARASGTQRERREHERERHEPYDDPAEHLEIERRRFAGGLPPTPELYARAREQWYRLPGALVRPSMDPVVGDRPPVSAASGAGSSGRARPEQ